MCEGGSHKEILSWNTNKMSKTEKSYVMSRKTLEQRQYEHWLETLRLAPGI